MSLYLKYRPSDFDNLMGQSFVKDTLRKAIANQKTVGAYLLCGPRGTGKTTTARLLAKTINCLNPKDGNPCLECEICKNFAEERLVDIVEIDAASHTGVDNIRELIEKAQFSPTRTKYKIYIIDEVHMLSKGAFNALLKILEEPPSFVKFILATTETHKVPETIISRCQRYDFKRISNADIKNRLVYIAKKENISVDEKSYDYIVSNSNGGLRNAISLFEQLIADNEINYDHLVEKLGIISENETKDFLSKLLLRDSSIIDDFDKLVSDGKNIKLFFKELLFFSKNVALNELKKNNDISNYIKIIEILDDTYIKTKNSIDENTTFIIGVLKIIQNVNTSIVENIEKPIFSAKIEKKVENNNYISEEKIEIIKIKSETISESDIEDIFSSGNVEIPKANNLSGFDSGLFISNLKLAKAKGALTMSLLGAEMNINGSGLVIKTKTSIMKKSIENADNFSLMLKVLSDMGMPDMKISII
ncbi:MAG: DNA polymerase III subunit gamma/tau [Candidatus Gracilibacteria bacterium]|nr:DNA polymerase III subunit gamma/tau [Candidatus Gracilibacteria bacterium]